MTLRQYSTSRTLHAGCFVCHGDVAHWFGSNAQAVAARHHDATGHPTWCDVCMTVFYGPPSEAEKALIAAEATKGKR
jgi:hypothetical protein